MANGTVIVSETLPTVLGMGVVSETTRVMFDKRGRRIRGKSQYRSRPKSATVIVGVSPTRSGAENFATGYRKALRRQGKPYINRVQVKKVQGGYAAIHLKGR